MKENRFTCTVNLEECELSICSMYLYMYCIKPGVISVEVYSVMPLSQKKNNV